jgi:hypothetical protein
VNQRIEKLKDTIELNHHCRAEHVDSKAVIEMAGEKTVWEGVVEVFELVGHGEAKRCYGWLSKIGRVRRWLPSWNCRRCVPRN